MKVYIERNYLQVELIRYRKKLFSRLLLRSDGFSALSLTERKSGGFEHKTLLGSVSDSLGRLATARDSSRQLATASQCRGSIYK